MISRYCCHVLCPPACTNECTWLPLSLFTLTLYLPLLCHQLLFHSLCFSASLLCCFHLSYSFKMLPSLHASVLHPSNTHNHAHKHTQYLCFISPAVCLSLSAGPPICWSCPNNSSEEHFTPSHCPPLLMFPTLSHISQTFLRPYLLLLCSSYSRHLPLSLAMLSFIIHQASCSSLVSPPNFTPYSSGIEMQGSWSRNQDKLSLQVTVSVPADRNQSPPQDTAPFVVFFSLVQVILFQFSCLLLFTPSTNNHYSLEK